MPTDLPRTSIYVPENSQLLFADCPHCDYPFPLGLAARADPNEVWCSRCQCPFIVEPPTLDEETPVGAERARAY